MDAPNFYAGGRIDRAAHHRRDPAALAGLATRDGSRWLPVWRGLSLVIDTETGPAAVRLPLNPRILAEATQIFLGLAAGNPLFTGDLSDRDEPLSALAAPGGARFADLRTVGPLMSRDDGSVLAYAKGLVHWHQRHRFCGVCGHPTESIDAGHVRRCTHSACATSHFPRTDPAVIMLVTDGNRCLLGRQKTWLPGMHSTLAGFVEPGESLEEAVAREVLEETGISVDQVTYHSSQPWPFPASLMLGFHARATSATVTVDTEELEAARWYDRDWLLAHTDDDSFRLPRRDSIARRLIETWLGRVPPAPVE